uniref:galactoside alpha-(1,2)-fucosyltransferase 2-like n=1 Tax=Myxine glutinosa TaxID=7769 RepID=UPI0035902D24
MILHHLVYKTTLLLNTVKVFSLRRSRALVCLLLAAFIFSLGWMVWKGKIVLGQRLPRGSWTSQPQGRLGNLMGEYATLLALSMLNGGRPILMPKMGARLKSIFEVNAAVMTSMESYATPWQEFPLNDWMTEEYKHIRAPYVKLKGYPCSWTFYHHMSSFVRREFTFLPPLRDYATATLRKAMAGRQSATFIGVHVRRGDYVRVMPNVWRGVIGDPEYLRKAIDVFRSRYPDAVFMVASDDMAWCQRHLDVTRGDVIFVGDNNQAEPQMDLAVLSNCNHTIFTVGTFGFWAAYLAGGDAIYLSNFTLPDSPFRLVFQEDKAYLPHWMGIPANLNAFPLQPPCEGHKWLFNLC